MFKKRKNFSILEDKIEKEKEEIVATTLALKEEKELFEKKEKERFFNKYKSNLNEWEVLIKRSVFNIENDEMKYFLRIIPIFSAKTSIIRPYYDYYDNIYIVDYQVPKKIFDKINEKNGENNIIEIIAEKQKEE